MILYAATIFISAFLLFQVQPLIAKIILPWFGGSAAVWTMCMLFFQLLLLAGYLYSHGLAQMRPKAQRYVHIALLIAGATMLPILPGAQWKPISGDDPTWRILGLLGVSVGVPYFMLSTTGPLVQAWFARANHGATPYRLFALSNFGSMLALLAYPVLFEPFLPLRSQAMGWSVGFVVFVLLCAALAWRSSGFDQAASSNPESRVARPSVALHALWAALACCASVLLLAFTGHLSLNIAAIPFLWVLPLALYLLSFILCFDSSGWYRRWLFIPLLAAGFSGVCYTIAHGNPSLALAIPLYSATLFVACMVCHGELARAKPDPSHLTGFYLMIALGGALGGVFVGLIAPRAINDLYELPIGMLLLCPLLYAALYRDRTGILHGRFAWPARVMLIALTMALGGTLIHIFRDKSADARLITRNFYGVLKVEDSGEGVEAMRTLSHGTIIHGKQYLSPERRNWPTTYYARASGVGMSILDADRRGPVRVGVVGLGTGTLASYGRSGDVFRIYDINPRVVELARSEFTYLGDSKARVEIALGDARLSLEREPNQNFDVLALDAFSSDSIPVHLLTREAFRTYVRHLKPGGILAVHISNRYLDLAPVVREAAREFALEAREVNNDDDDDKGVYQSDWVLLGASAAVFEREPLKGSAEKLSDERKATLWTDDYSNLFRILK